MSFLEEVKKRRKVKLVDYPIITSAADDDFYKPKGSAVFWLKYPGSVATYRFYNRNPNMPLGYLAENIQNQLRMIKGLGYKDDELDCLAENKIPGKYLTGFLESFKYNPNLVDVFDNQGFLDLRIGGPAEEATLYEVKLLSIISELHSIFSTDGYEAVKPIGEANLNEDISLINQHGFWLAEMGARRRAFKQWQEHMVGRLVKECPSFAGTSNIWLAMKYKTKLVGTMHHESIMLQQALCKEIRWAQLTALKVWHEIFPNDRVVLTDTIGTDRFFKDFNRELAEWFPIQRIDSGDPKEEGQKMIDQCFLKEIDLGNVEALFSDALNTKKCVELFLYFLNELLKTRFAMGTHLSNNMGFQAPNIVIKAETCNGIGLVKESNVPGKKMGSLEMSEKIKMAYQD